MLSFLFQCFQDWTSPADLGDIQHDIRSRHRIHITRILARSLAVKLRRRHCWFDARQQSRQTAQHDVVDRTFHRPTCGVSQNQHQLRARNGTGKLHAAQHVVVDDVSRNPSGENIADACIENDFGWHSGIHASKYHRRWVLPSRA